MSSKSRFSNRFITPPCLYPTGVNQQLYPKAGLSKHHQHCFLLTKRVLWLCYLEKISRGHRRNKNHPILMYPNHVP
ncbi:hypothetical protein Hanom_Chr03g00203071 [Helianthus anomalus]